jgi:tRNA(Leu) C34 or U34 (ribose-2'-O)-methylase TrmL
LSADAVSTSIAIDRSQERERGEGRHRSQKSFRAALLFAWLTSQESLRFARPACPPREHWERKDYVEEGCNSTSLVDAALPTPAVLLLGREKEGVPNDLMDLVDVCVEIPQLGVVRSLNVHVSGALCIWHFARQHLLARN